MARVRIAKYLDLANRDFFTPRGLHATIAKQGVLSQITGQPEGAPLLAPLPQNVPGDPTMYPSIRDRRVQAMQRYIAPLEFQNATDVHHEGNMLDKLSAKMVQRQANKSQKKMIENHAKGQEEESKEREKLEEEEEKLRKEERKVNEKAEKELRKHPDEQAKIEKERSKDMAKINEDRSKAHADYTEKAHPETKDADRDAKKFMWIAILKLQK